MERRLAGTDLLDGCSAALPIREVRTGMGRVGHPGDWRNLDRLGNLRRGHSRLVRDSGIQSVNQEAPIGFPGIPRQELFGIPSDTIYPPQEGTHCGENGIASHERSDGDHAARARRPHPTRYCWQPGARREKPDPIPVCGRTHAGRDRVRRDQENVRCTILGLKRG